MKKKSAKRYYKKRNNSKMSSQDFSRKLMKALNKAMTRKKMMFGGASAAQFIEVTSPAADTVSKRTISDVKIVDSCTDGMPTDFSEFAKKYYDTSTNKDELKLCLPATFEQDNGKNTRLIKINFDSKEDKDLQQDITNTVTNNGQGQGT